VPLAPQVGLQRHLTKPVDGVRQPALKREPPHLAVCHHLDPGVLLQRHGRVHGRILDRLELGRCELAGLQPPPGCEQLGRAQQAAHDVRMHGDHGSAV
jgi:hypothetical protein